MYIVKMERNCLGDTRTATHMPTREEFEEANESHCDDVAGLVGAFCTELFNRVQDHDWTKLVEPYATMFYNEMKSTIEEHREFTGGEWYRLHSTVLERHHLLERCPEDVTLFDVIEMLCDCVAAGMARTGHVYPIVLPDEILQKAVSNTVDYLVKHIEVVDRKTEPQTEFPMCPINGTPFDECGFCEHFNCDTCKCEAQTERSEQMGIKLYDSNGKYWGEYDETRNLFIPSEETITQTETQNSNLTFEKDECAKEYEELGLKELKELIEADRKTEPSLSDKPTSSEKPNNCEHITEDGVTCAKYPACDDCLGNPLNKVKGSERLVKGSEQAERSSE